MTKSLKARTQDLVRDAIYDAAIDLFTRKGFDETTVEEVAQAAGVSRRSFFRYFASKDDLLAQSVVNYGITLSTAVSACPADFTALAVIRKTVLATCKDLAAQPRMRQVIEIAERSTSARQAHRSRMMEVEDALAQTFAARLRGSSKKDLKPRLLASLTILVMNVTVVSWFRGEHQKLSTAAKQVFLNLTRSLCEKTSEASRSGKATKSRKAGGAAGRRGSSRTKR
ncbi:MAG: TetR family transcriptional regulator [Acidobacteriota bacterium]|nr:TetR family transcriptional regulator [Acidobacteriota bacterium]